MLIALVTNFSELIKAGTLGKQVWFSAWGAGWVVKAYLCRCKSFVNGSLKSRPTSHMKHKKGRGGVRSLQISMFLKQRDEGCKSLLIFHWAFQEVAFDVGEVMWPAVFAMLIWRGEMTGGCALSLYKKEGSQSQYTARVLTNLCLYTPTLHRRVSHQLDIFLVCLWLWVCARPAQWAGVKRVKPSGMCILLKPLPPRCCWPCML